MAVSHATARRELGRQLGPYGVFTAQSGSTTTLVCGSAFASSVLPTDNQAYAWVYVPSVTIPRLRRVTATGVDGTTGTITVDAGFGSAVGFNTVFEISGRLPQVHETSPAQGTVAMGESLQGCLNLALRHILVDQRDYALALSPNVNDFALPTWLDRPARLLDVLEPSGTGATRRSSWRTWELRPDAGGNQLHLEEPYRYVSGSYELHLVVKRPAETWINGADSTVGFSAEADTADVELAQLIPVALAFGYRALRDGRAPGAARNRYDALYRRQVRLARRVHNYDTSNDMDPGVEDGPTEEEAA